jgi:hypothetical protein
MKRHLHLAVLFFCSSALFSKSAELEFFLTEKNGTPIREGTEDYASALQFAQTSPDARPASQDTGGNWGDTAGGVQMSVRFEKPEFVVGEKISVWVIVRNVAQTNIFYPIDFYDPFSRMSGTITVRDNQGLALAKTNASPWTAKGGHQTIRPGWQRKFDVRLDNVFALSAPASYSLSIIKRVYGTNGEVMVESGTATFNVVSSTNTMVSSNSAPVSKPPIQALSVEKLTVSPNLDPPAQPSRPPESSISAEPSSAATTNTTDKLDDSVAVQSSKGRITLGFLAVCAFALLAVLWRAARRNR